MIGASASGGNVPHLSNFCLNLRESGVGIEVQPQMHGYRAEALRARRFHVVDAISARDNALERSGDIPTDQISTRPDVHPS